MVEAAFVPNQVLWARPVCLHTTDTGLLNPAGPDWALHPADISDWMKPPKAALGPPIPEVFVKHPAQSSCEPDGEGAGKMLTSARSSQALQSPGQELW